MTKELQKIRELHNMRMKPLKKKKEQPNVTKKLSHMMLELHNVRMKPSNVIILITWYSRLLTSEYRRITLYIYMTKTFNF